LALTRAYARHDNVGRLNLRQCLAFGHVGLCEVDGKGQQPGNPKDEMPRAHGRAIRKLNVEGLNFSSRGFDDLSEFHAFVLTNAQAALHVQISGNPAAARELVRQKERARQLERFYQHAPLDRLRDGNPETSASSNIDLETLRELKQINTCFITLAYPILTESGDLLETRLKRVPV
jgi:phosphate:Na+ symporter